MCGRFTYLYSWQQLHRLMALVDWPAVTLAPHYNLRPSNPAPAVRLDERGARIGVMPTWGFAAPRPGSPSLINARGESVFSKPTFREAARSRRCLVPISGFYEWQRVPGEKTTHPHYITRADGAPFCVAGLWTLQPAQTPLETFVLITTSPNPLMASLHDRMPVIVPEAHWSAWLDPRTPQAALERVITPYQGSDLTAHPVGRGVNGQRNDPSLIQPAAPPPTTMGLFG